MSSETARRRHLPVVDCLLKRYKAAQRDKLVADEKHDDKAARAARDQLEALLLFKNDMGAYVRLYAFLGQIFDYGNTNIEKRFLFYKRRSGSRGLQTFESCYTTD